MRIKKSGYIIVSSITIVVILLSYFDVINFFGIVEIYFRRSKADILSDHTFNFKTMNDINIFSYLSQIFNFNQKIDLLYYISQMFMYLSLLMPFFGLLVGLQYFDMHHTINKVIYYRLEKPKNSFKYSVKIINKIALPLAILTVGIYIITVLSLVLLYNGVDSMNYPNVFLGELLGNSFSESQTIMYVVGIGLLQYFLVSYITVFFVASLSTLVANKMQIFMIVVLYYFGFAFISNLLMGILPNNSALYFDPLSLMRVTSYGGYNLWLLIISNLVPLMLAVIFLKIGQYNET